MFIVEVKPHTKFNRENDDLVVSLEISLVEAQAKTPRVTKGTKLTTLDSRSLSVPFLDRVIESGQKTEIPRESMPIEDDNGEIQSKGKLIVKGHIVSLSNLTSSPEGICIVDGLILFKNSKSLLLPRKRCDI